MASNLEAEIVVDAPVEQVWTLVSDLRRMPQWSPTCLKVLARGPVRMGTRMLNINGNGRYVWPTTSKVSDFSYQQRVAWVIQDNGSEWSFTLTSTDGGTRITHRRDVPGGHISKLSGLLIEKVLGGEKKFEAELVKGMNATLGRIRIEVERGM